MLDLIDALHALAQTGTTARAAARLRLTQSAVSKRIAALEAEVGVPVVEKVGRRLVLTPAGARLLAEVEPHLRAIRGELAALRGGGPAGRVRAAASESLLASWLPAALAAAAAGADVELELHAHRGPLVLERVRGGHVDVGVCVAGAEDGLQSRPLADEGMVLVGAPGAAPPGPPAAPVEVWTIEARSLTGEWLDRRLPRHPWPLRAARRIESFSAAVQLARAGFGPALVPIGIARAMGVPASELLPVPGLARPLVAVHTVGAGERAAVAALLDRLVAAAGRAVAG